MPCSGHYQDLRVISSSTRHASACNLILTLTVAWFVRALLQALFNNTNVLAIPGALRLYGFDTKSLNRQFRDLVTPPSS